MFLKLKTRIDNDSNYIQLNNIELAKLGGNTSEFLPLNSRIVDFSLNNKHFEQIVEMLEDMKKIAYDLEISKGYNILQCVYCEENVVPTEEEILKIEKDALLKLRQQG